MNTGLFVLVGTVTVIVLCYLLYKLMTNMAKNKIEGTGIVEDQDPLQKGLNICPGKDGLTELVSEEPTKELISKTIIEMDWSTISFVILAYETDSWVEVSGSTQEGFCCKYKNGYLERLAEPPPESIKEMEEILCAFLANPEVAFEKYRFV